MKNELLAQIKDKQISFATKSNDISKLYYQFCDELRQKYGELNADYDDILIRKRGGEWLDIHHKCEIFKPGELGTIGLDNISARTTRAIQNNDRHELAMLKPYNKKEELVYASKVDHFALHYLIDIYRGINVASGGVWYLTPAIFDMQFKDNFKMPYLKKLQKEQKESQNLFDNEDFNFVMKSAKYLRDARVKLNNIKGYDNFITTQANAVKVCDMDKYKSLIMG